MQYYKVPGDLGLARFVDYWILDTRSFSSCNARMLGFLGLAGLKISWFRRLPTISLINVIPAVRRALRQACSLRLAMSRERL